ncbi:MAG: fibronectin type III domain-containing protein [Kineosporiaceae bacterium]
MHRNRIAAAALALTLGASVAGVLTGTPAQAMPCWDLPSPPPTCVDPNDPGEDPQPEPPFMPTNVTAPSVLQTWVTVAWKDNSGDETGFRVIRENLATHAISTFTAPAGATSYGDSTAAANTPYRYTVRAYNAVGDSGGLSVDVRTHEQPADVIGSASGGVYSGTNWYGTKYSYVSFTGWALDFDRAGTIDVRFVQDGGTVLATTTASAASGLGLAAKYPGYGDNHGFTYSWLPLSTVKGPHTVCAIGVSVGGGADKQLGCVTYTSPGAPSAPTDLTITPKAYTTEVVFTDRADDETGWYPAAQHGRRRHVGAGHLRRGHDRRREQGHGGRLLDLLAAGLLPRPRGELLRPDAERQGLPLTTAHSRGGRCRDTGAARPCPPVTVPRPSTSAATPG